MNYLLFFFCATGEKVVKQSKTKDKCWVKQCQVVNTILIISRKRYFIYKWENKYRLIST